MPSAKSDIVDHHAQSGSRSRIQIQAHACRLGACCGRSDHRRVLIAIGKSVAEIIVETPKNAGVMRLLRRGRRRVESARPLNGIYDANRAAVILITSQIIRDELGFEFIQEVNFRQVYRD
jgi:hypothetical protein